MAAQPPVPIQQNRMFQLFEFLKAYIEHRYPPVRSIEQQLKTLRLGDLPQHPAIQLRRDIAPKEESEDTDVVLQITRPTLTACPPPPSAIADWLKPGWDRVDNAPEVIPSRNVPDRELSTLRERLR